jgi:hypothetical protein
MKGKLVCFLLIIVLFVIIVGGCCGLSGNGPGINGTNTTGGQGNTGGNGTGTVGAGGSSGTGSQGSGTGGQNSDDNPLANNKHTFSVAAGTGYSFVVRDDNKATRLSLMIYPESLKENISLTVAPPAGLPSGFVPNTDITFGPEGLKFQKPATLYIVYKPDKIPAGVDESSLRLCKLVDGKWQPVDGSTIDTATHSVQGELSGFSTYAVASGGSYNISDATISFVDPAPVCFPGGSVELKATVSNIPDIYLKNTNSYMFRYIWNTTAKSGQLMNRYQLVGGGYIEAISNVITTKTFNITYVADEKARMGDTDQVKVVLWAAYVNDTGYRQAFKLCEASVTVTIGTPTVSINPQKTAVNAGDRVKLTPVLSGLPAGVSNAKDLGIRYVWSTDGKYGSMYTINGGGNSKQLTTTYPDTSIYYQADPNAPVGSAENVTLISGYRMHMNESDIDGTWVTLSTATANITIMESLVWIEANSEIPVSPPQLDVRRDGDLGLTARFSNDVSGNFVYHW